MKLSNVSNHISTAGRGGGSRYLDDHNATRGRGMPQQARALTIEDSANKGIPVTRQWHKMKIPTIALDTHIKDNCPGQPHLHKSLTSLYFTWSRQTMQHHISSNWWAPSIGFTIKEAQRPQGSYWWSASCFSERLNGSTQSITISSNIPTTKEGAEMYSQHRVGDGVREKINVAMSKTMGDMKYIATPFRMYLNKEKVPVSQEFLDLVDARIICVMLHTDPQLMFWDDIKSSIFDIMLWYTNFSLHQMCRQANAKNDNPKFANGLAIQVAIKDGKEKEAYTDKISKAMEFFNEHGNHPILSQCVFFPFGRGAAIDQYTFCSFIRMQNEFLHNTHVEIHGLADIDIDRHLENTIDDGE
jgi:hypothetical protein